MQCCFVYSSRTIVCTPRDRKLHTQQRRRVLKSPEISPLRRSPLRFLQCLAPMILRRLLRNAQEFVEKGELASSARHPRPRTRLTPPVWRSPGRSAQPVARGPENALPLQHARGAGAVDHVFGRPAGRAVHRGAGALGSLPSERPRRVGMHALLPPPLPRRPPRHAPLPAARRAPPSSAAPSAARWASPPAGG